MRLPTRHVFAVEECDESVGRDAGIRRGRARRTNLFLAACRRRCRLGLYGHGWRRMAYKRDRQRSVLAACDLELFGDRLIAVALDLELMLADVERERLVEPADINVIAVDRDADIR